MLHQHFIAGADAPPATGRRLPVVNPSDGRPFAELARGDATDIDSAVRAARTAFDQVWSRMTAAERGRLLLRLSQRIAAAADELAALECEDVGKPLRQARSDALALARYFEYYAGACDKLHGDTLPYLNGHTALTWREPHGVTGHIVPWNYPMQIAGRSIAAALAAGNCCVVKPAEDASLSVLRLARLAIEADLPAGALNVVTGLGHEAGEALVRHPGIAHISFTGSPATGTRVQQAAAERHCPVTLELGGKSPQIVFADADLGRALPAVVSAIVQNAGQTCSAGSRLLVQRPIYDAVLADLAGRFERLRAGPAQMDLDLGPLVSQRQQQRVWDFLSDAHASGLTLLAQGRVVDEAPEAGFYQAPVLLRDVPPAHRLAQEEIFGPVLVAMPFDDEAEAVALANGTPYGLVAGVWTTDGARQLRLARALRAGQVFVNDYGAGGGVELPFGGSGRSGHGREKGFEALYGFTTVKTVVLRHG